MTDPREVSAEKRAAIDRIFENLPEDPGQNMLQLSALNQAVREKIAEVLEPKLNALLEPLQPKSHWEHRQLTEHVDANLANLGLCASFRGEPALLVSERNTGIQEPQSQYAILVLGDRKKVERKLVSEKPPALKLMAAPDNVKVLLDPLRKKSNRNFERSWGVR